MNFEKKIEEATKEEILHWINSRNPHFTSLASDELTRRDIRKLEESINENTKEIGRFADASIKFNTETSTQTEKMIKMTKTMKFLTWVMVIGLAIQIILAIPKKQSCWISVSSDAPNIQKADCMNTLNFGILGSLNWRSYEETQN